jgi:hypothetical protein
MLNVLMDLRVNLDSLAGIASLSTATPIPSVRGKAPAVPTVYAGLLVVVEVVAAVVERAFQEKARDVALKTLVA